MLAKLMFMEAQKALSQLAIGAFFYVYRSCEYLRIPQHEKRRTAILQLYNICFFTSALSPSTTPLVSMHHATLPSPSSGKRKIHAWTLSHSGPPATFSFAQSEPGPLLSTAYGDTRGHPRYTSVRGPAQQSYRTHHLCRNGTSPEVRSCLGR